MNLNKTMERVSDNKVISSNGDKVYEILGLEEIDAIIKDLNEWSDKFFSKGILTETLKTVEYTHGSSPTYANLCSLMANLKSGYKPNSKFVMSSKMLWETIATITVGNQLVFLPDPTGEFAQTR